MEGFVLVDRLCVATVRLNYSVVVNETGSSYLIGVKCHKREEFVVRETWNDDDDDDDDDGIGSIVTGDLLLL